ncbi:MAG: hemolysin III family protein [Candidatus Latescibacterota bacterium]|nr:hemolysin III family protein [Candidatus Latescibacterota bacterium]
MLPPIRRCKFLGISLREPFSGLSHLFAMTVYAILFPLLLTNNSSDQTTAKIIYGASLIFAFLASAVYHLVDLKKSLTDLLRRIDHSSIYLLIAGSYTPICQYFFTGFFREELLGIIWIISIIGVLITLITLNKPRWITASIFVSMGWLSCLAFEQMLTQMPQTAFFWLLTGGLFFSFGALIYVKKKPNPLPGIIGFHEIWHLFVIAGSMCHFIVVAFYIV